MTAVEKIYASTIEECINDLADFAKNTKISGADNEEDIGKLELAFLKKMKTVKIATGI